MRPSEDGVAGHRSERAGRRGGAKRALQASCEHTSEPSARVVPISYKYSCSEHEGSTVAIAETIGLSTRRGQHPSAPWHGSTGTNANSMSDATSGARAGRRHDRRSAYRRDGGSTRARVLALQHRHGRKFDVGRRERRSGGQAARSEIGLSTRRGQHPSTRLGLAGPARMEIRCRTPGRR